MSKPIPEGVSVRHGRRRSEMSFLDVSCEVVEAQALDVGLQAGNG